jgi:hypothetical protein
LRSAAIVAESRAFAFEPRVRVIRATSPSKSSRTFAIGPGSYPDRPDRLPGHVDGFPPAAPGLLNLADTEPPLVFRPANYDASTHDPLGRVLSIGVRFGL